MPGTSLKYSVPCRRQTFSGGFLETGLADSFYDEDSKCPNCARKVKDDWQTKRLESLMQSWRKGDFLQYTKFEEVPEKGGKKKNRRLGPFFRRTKEYVSKTPLLLNGKIPVHTFCHYCDAWLEAYAKILNGRFVGIIEVEADGEEKEFIRMPPETTAKALREEFERRLSHLRESCKHEKTKWMDIEWAPAHFSGRALVCLRCEEILKRKPGMWTGKAPRGKNRTTRNLDLFHQACSPTGRSSERLKQALRKGRAEDHLAKEMKKKPFAVKPMFLESQGLPRPVRAKVGRAKLGRKASPDSGEATFSD